MLEKVTTRGGRLNTACTEKKGGGETKNLIICNTRGTAGRLSLSLSLSEMKRKIEEPTASKGFHGGNLASVGREGQANTLPVSRTFLCCLFQILKLEFKFVWLWKYKGETARHRFHSVQPKCVCVRAVPVRCVRVFPSWCRCCGRADIRYQVDRPYSNQSSVLSYLFHYLIFPPHHLHLTSRSNTNLQIRKNVRVQQDHHGGAQAAQLPRGPLASHRRQGCVSTQFEPSTDVIAAHGRYPSYIARYDTEPMNCKVN